MPDAAQERGCGMEQEAKREGLAPYVAFKTFLTALDTLTQGLPNKIDRSVWPSFSGGVQSQMLSAFRFLKLIGTGGNVQPELRALVEDRDQREANMRALLEARYPTMLALARDHASPMQFENAMREIAGEGTLRKAVAFFLPAAAYAGLTIPNTWHTRRKRGAGAAPRGKKTERQDGTKATAASRQKRAEPRHEPGMAKTVRLRSGGTVTLSVSVDLMNLDLADREWLFELIDKLGTYEKDAAPTDGPTRPNEVAAGDN